LFWEIKLTLKEAQQIYMALNFLTNPRKLQKLSDTILLVDKGEKQVSSTLDHDLMHNHPYAERRFTQEHENLDKLISIFKTVDLDRIY
jgi:diphosphomevalonate decarboxylase